MTCCGDLKSVLVGKFGFTWEHADSIVKAVLETARDPEFAIRYAKEADEPNRSENDLMLEYWRIIRFLQWTNE